MKSCLKHSKKRDISQVILEADQWDSFLHEIKTFNQPGSLVGYTSAFINSGMKFNHQSAYNQVKKINISYTFDLDQLPVSFGLSLETSSDNIIDLNPLNQAIGQLVELIHEAGGYRFRQKCIAKDPAITYYYYCSQDSSRWQRSGRLGKRDRHQMERFDCQSLLKISPELSERRLQVALSHNHHGSYVKIELSGDIRDFISKRCATHSPAEIYNELQSSDLPDVGAVAQHQIYYQWQHANASKWKYDPDPFTSASIFLASQKKYRYAVYVCGNFRGLAIYINDSMNTLASSSKELAIDATYGTNNSGISIFFTFHSSDLGSNILDSSAASLCSTAKS